MRNGICDEQIKVLKAMKTGSGMKSLQARFVAIFLQLLVTSVLYDEKVRFAAAEIL